MSNLILLDDRKIRKQAFASLEKLLKKLQRMEGHVDSFHDRDERLFHEWFELTFRDDNREVASLRGQYRELADFHNHMHALAQMEDLPLPEAAYLLREEERIYQSASFEQRREIEEDRRLREQFIRAQTQRNERREESSSPGPIDEEDLEEMELLNELDNEELEEWCASSQTAFLLLGKTLRVANYTKDFELFFRLWDSTHSKIQRDFARQFEKQHGYPLMEALEQMRERFSTGGEQGERKEALKLQYRQLVRKLHPDVHEADARASEIWRKKMWEQVQEAYEREDLQSLNRLFHLVLLRTRELEQLRLSELHLSRRWISDEIERLSDLTKRLRRKPAWGFSRRKNFEPIKRKIERDLRQVRRDLENQVAELRVHHARLERLGRESLNRRRRSVSLRFP